MKKKNPAAVALGSIKSKRKAKASRENGKKGGRPLKCRCKTNARLAHHAFAGNKSIKYFKPCPIHDFLAPSPTLDK